MARLIVILDPTDMVQPPEYSWAQQRGVITAVVEVPHTFLREEEDLQRRAIDRLLDVFITLQRQ